MKPNSFPRLQREEKHHLRERERDHREIDALAADRQGSGDQAENTSHGSARQDGKLGRETPDLGGIGRKIARPAEIERVTEREQSHIADQQVEGAGEQRKAERLHQEQWIDEERRDHEHRDHDGERDGLAAAFGRANRRRGCGNAHHVTPSFRTGRPDGAAARSP
jgi:hypothetical protein